MTPKKYVPTIFILSILVFSLFAVSTSSVDSEPETSKEETSTGNSLLQTDDFAGGNGSKENPYQISNWTHLNSIGTHLDANFILENDLDSTTDGYGDHASDTANDGKGWNPIGDYSLDPFTGTFDGNNYEIRDLNINRTDTDYIGIIAYSSDSEIYDLGVVNVDISGDKYVGGIIGENDGMVNNSYTSGNMNGDRYVGGFIGRSKGDISNSYSDVDVIFEGQYGGGFIGDINTMTLNNSYSTGNVSGGTEIGGLVGYNFDSTIRNSYATGVVDSDYVDSENDIGGLVGSNSGGIIEKCYATGNVYAKGNISGGLVGYNDGTVNNSYATGNVNGSVSYVGGLVGKNQLEIKKSYSVGYVEGDSDVGLLVGINYNVIYDSIALNRTDVDLIGTQDYEVYGRVTSAPEEDMKDIGLYMDDNFKDYEPLNESWDITENMVSFEEGNSYPYHNSTWSIDQVYYELNISSTVGGSVTQPGEGIFEYKYNTTVELDGIVDSGFTFKEWTGDNGTIENTTSLQTNITILDNYTITAEFTHNINFYNPDPPDGAENVSTELQLSIDIYHDLGEDMTVEFYDQEDDLIGSEDGILNETASVNYPDLEYDTTYTWYVMATSENDTRESQEFTFTTELESIDFKIETHAPLDDYVRPTEPIKLKFNREADLTSLEDGFSFNDGTDVYNITDVSFSWQSDYNIAVFDPHENFEQQQTYNVIIKESVQAESGNETLDDDYIYNFTVGDFVNPTVNISVEPNFEDTYVHTIIYLNFSEPMNKTSVNESLSIEVEYSSGWADMWFYKESLPEYELIWTSNSSAEVHFDEHLQPSSMYNITVSNNATDLAIEPNTLDGNHNTFHSTEFHTEWRIPAYIVYFILMIGLFIGIKMLIQIVQDNKLFRGEEV